MNEQIRISPIRVIGAANEQIGVIPTFEALRMAQDAGLDLVEVQPNVRPPVCKIMDYGKWKYEQKKHAKKHHEQQTKELRMTPKTDAHDRRIKVNHAIDFLGKGDKVQFTMRFRGRERSHREIGFAAFQEMLAAIGELAKVERAPSMDAGSLIMILSPNKQALDKLKPDKPADHTGDGKLTSVKSATAPPESAPASGAAQ
ncbi:MAG: translation initiation factor IF-3 [Phycisphaerales bacterium]|nr:translation initiation factor IF-3 [Phycisphaerales bacterium]